ncbi:hypothetical protein BJX61DRAFT_39373 [Aspergillus egyptiacus]|nr:hypothetical protein BJX61DRAFT_39373 [Aspergillus egyptiacus]
MAGGVQRRGEQLDKVIEISQRAFDLKGYLVGQYQIITPFPYPYLLCATPVTTPRSPIMNPTPATVEQVISTRYLDMGKLEALLSVRFRNGFMVNVKGGRFYLTVPSPLSQEDIDSCCVKPEARVPVL